MMNESLEEETDSRVAFANSAGRKIINAICWLSLGRKLFKLIWMINWFWHSAWRLGSIGKNVWLKYGFVKCFVSCGWSSWTGHQSIKGPIQRHWDKPASMHTFRHYGNVTWTCVRYVWTVEPRESASILKENMQTSHRTYRIGIFRITYYKVLETC